MTFTSNTLGKVIYFVIVLESIARAIKLVKFIRTSTGQTLFCSGRPVPASTKLFKLFPTKKTQSQ